VSQILIDRQTGDQTGDTYVFHNRPVGRQNYVSAKQRLLPLDATWQQVCSQIRWPTDLLPEVLGSGQVTIPALIREYLFVSLFRSCAESLASENACRLTAMQRAQRNIDELLDRLQMAFNQQ
jgi:F-type H+-transporting ATPase subunit gamma